MNVAMTHFIESVTEVLMKLTNWRLSVFLFLFALQHYYLGFYYLNVLY